MARTSKPSATVFVALLRGVNVGGNNMISMASLKASFERMGFDHVSTYINSGNILFKTKQDDLRKLESKIEKMLTSEHKLDCKVVVRSLAEIAKLVENWPQDWDSDQDWKYNVIFLRHSIDSQEVLKELAPEPDIEQVVYYPGTLLWSARISAMSRTRMQKLSSRKVFQDMTVRNPNTTRKLYELMKKMSEDKC
jgi:uncharacterized protein (DUF1697 family)